MSKNRQTTPGEFPIDEYRTNDFHQALKEIIGLFRGQHQFAVSYLGDEIIINYTTGPYKR